MRIFTVRELLDKIFKKLTFPILLQRKGMAEVKKSTYQQNNQAVHFAFTGMPKQNAYFPTFEIKFPPKT